MKRLRNYFISGLLFWLPLGVTIILIKFFLESIDDIFPTQYLPEILFSLKTDFPGAGVFWTIVVIFVTGIFVNNLIGRKVVKLWEKALNKIPGFRGIYGALKQLSSTILDTSKDSFKKVVLVEYPRIGMWTIAFQTGNYSGEVEKKIGQEIINIYVPTTPNPTSGFFIFVPKKDIIELDLTIDEAFKLIISTGVVEPKTKEKT